MLNITFADITRELVIDTVFLPGEVIRIYFSGTRENAMTINENDLRNAGFTERDIADLHTRLSRAGGTIDELITALARRFSVSLWITVALILVMMFALYTGNRTHIISGSVSAAIVLLIAWCTFPPLLAWKARQLRNTISRQVR